MGLLVAVHLHPVFQPAQQSVGIGERSRLGRIDHPALAQQCQQVQGVAVAQRRIAAAADDRFQLHPELDLADAAGAEFQIVFALAAAHLGIDQRLQFAQAFERCVVEIAAPDEGPQALQQLAPSRQVAAHRARAQQGEALPLAAFALVVILHRIEGQRQASGGAEGTQAPVDAIAETLRGGLAEQCAGALHQACEEILVVQRASAIGLAGARKGGDQIDVAGEVQLARAELAQAIDHHRLNRAILVARLAVTCDQFGACRGEGHLDAVLGQRGGTCQRALDAVAAEHLVDDDRQRLGAPVAAQRGTEIRIVRLRRPADGRAAIQQAEEVRAPAEFLEGKVAGQQHAIQRGRGMWRVERPATLADPLAPGRWQRGAHAAALMSPRSSAAANCTRRVTPQTSS